MTVYMLVLHVLAGSAIYQWWRKPLRLEATVPAARDSSRGRKPPVLEATEPAASDSSRGAKSPVPERDTLFDSVSDEDEPPSAEVKSKDGRRISAEELLSEFCNDTLSEMCRSRRLPYTGTKATLVHRILATSWRATDKQLAYMNHLAKKSYRLTIEMMDVDSKYSASRWLGAATSKAKRL